MCVCTTELTRGTLLKMASSTNLITPFRSGISPSTMAWLNNAVFRRCSSFTSNDRSSGVAAQSGHPTADGISRIIRVHNQHAYTHMQWPLSQGYSCYPATVLFAQLPLLYVRHSARCSPPKKTGRHKYYPLCPTIEEHCQSQGHRQS